MHIFFTPPSRASLHDSLDTPISSIDAVPIPEQEHARDPWWAAFLSLVAPGLGQVYSGRARRGAGVALGTTMGGVALVFLSLIVPDRMLRVAAILLIPALLIWAMADAFRVAKSQKGFALRWYNRWYVYVALWLAAALFVQPQLQELVYRNVAQAFVLRSGPMEPTILAGEYVLTAPIRGDAISGGMLVVYQVPDEGILVGRVAALPGDTVEMRRKVLHINGLPRRETYARHIDPLDDPRDERMLWQTGFLTTARPGYRPSRDNWGPLAVPPGQYLLLGDNRDNSMDSRYLGFVAREQIERRPVWIYLSRDVMDGAWRWHRIGRRIE
jgi:signal peptidase I